MAIFDNEPVDPRDDADYQAFLKSKEALATVDDDGSDHAANLRAMDPNLKPARTGEKHAEPAKAEWGEGVITGDPADHYVHLANGAVIPGSSGGTHYHDPEMGLVPIVSAFPAGRPVK